MSRNLRSRSRLLAGSAAVKYSPTMPTRKGRAGRFSGSARNASRPFRCASAISRSFVAARMSAKYASRARSNDPGSASNPAFAR